HRPGAMLARLVEVFQRGDGALHLRLGYPAVLARRATVLATLQSERDPIDIGAGMLGEFLQERRARGVSSALQVDVRDFGDGDLVHRLDCKGPGRSYQDLA